MSRYLIQRALGHPALPVSRKRVRVPITLSHDQEAFFEHLGAEASTQVEPGINQDEIFDDQFERRAHEIQRTPAASSAVSVVEPKTGPWTGNGQLGIERPFAPDVNNRQTAIKCDEWGFPQMWTICLGFNQFALSPNVAFDITAEIEFGAGGAVQVVEIDWLNGAAITVPMNAVNVVASYSTGTGEGATIIPEDLRLRATLARGRSQQARPVRTIYFQQGETAIQIPPFAKRVFIGANLSLPASTPFALYSSGGYIELSPFDNTAGPGGAIYLISQFVSSIDFTNQFVGGPQWCPIPPFARYLNVRNALGAYALLPGINFAQFEIGV